MLAAVRQRCAEVEASRQPLVRRPSAAAAPRMYNPRFEEDYAAGKDYDPDRFAPTACCQFPDQDVGLTTGGVLCMVSFVQMKCWQATSLVISICLDWR